MLALAASLGAFELRRESERGALLRSQPLRCSICHAVVKELLWEVHKHGIIANEGEEAVLDSVKACCLPVLQNYTLERDPSTLAVVLSPMRRGPDGVAPDESALDPVAARLLKEACFDITEEHDMVLGEQMWARAMGAGVDATRLAASLCGAESDGGIGLCGAKSEKRAKRRAAKAEAAAAKRRAKQDSKGAAKGAAKGAGKRKAKRKAKAKAKRGGVANGAELDDRFADFFAQINADGSMTAMLQRERDHPDAALPDDVRAAIRRARELPQVRCAVCAAAVEEFVVEAIAQRALGDEAALVEVGERARVCFGPVSAQSREMEMMSGIAAPDAPPLWAERFELRRTPPTERGAEAAAISPAGPAAAAGEESEWALALLTASELEARRPAARTAKKKKAKKAKKKARGRAGGVDVDAQPDLEELREIMLPGRAAPAAPAATQQADAHAIARTGHVVMGACRSVVDERLDELAEAVYARARTLPKACLRARDAADDADGLCGALAVDVAKSFCERTPRSCAPESAASASAPRASRSASRSEL